MDLIHDQIVVSKPIKKLRVVLITTKQPEDIWLINTVADFCNIVGIVFPIGTRYREYGIVYILKKKLRRLDVFGIANQALLFLYRLIFESRRDKQAAKEIFDGKPSDHIEKKGIDTLEVEDINSEQVRNFILLKAPQLVVVSGAPILKKHIIEPVEGKIINLHPGYAPQYKGRYGCFWPIYNEEPELVGTTVHFVDQGIDTGAILLQQQVDFNPDDTLKVITYRQHRIGVDLIVKCLEEFESLAAQAYHKTDCPNKNYLALGLTHYLKGKRWLKRINGDRKLASSA